MNFVSSLLPAKETYNLDDLNDVLPKLEENLSTFHNEISQMLDTARKDIQNQMDRGKIHIKTAHEIKTELRSVEKSLGDILLEDLKTADDSFSGLVEEVNEITTSISHVHLVCEIHERLEMLKTLCADCTDFMQIVELLHVLNVLIGSFPTVPIIPFVMGLREMVNEEKIRANALLKAEFFKNCSFTREKNSYVLRIKGKNNEFLCSLLPSIYKYEPTRELLSTLPNSIWENLLSPLIMHKCEIKEEIDEQYSILRVTTHKEENNKPDEVYQNISNLIDNLVEYFDFIIEDDLNMLNFIGSNLKDQLSGTIKLECVAKKIPRNWNDLPPFKDNLIDILKPLEDKLRTHGFLEGQWEWKDKIEEIYAQKKCKYFNEKAKQLIRKDLHHMMEVGTPYDPSKAFTETEEISHCSISTYIPELIKLGEELINEILEGPQENCEVLFTTYKGIFFNYGDFVASHHQKLLETIPQQVALFYNNCMYLYKQLQKWDEIFESNDVLKDYYRDKSTKQFYQVEEVGRMFFDSFVREQKEQIEIILRGTNIHNKKTLENLEDNTEKLLRQCLRQQELLKTVWSKVLSYPVYNQTIGDILNTMCNFFINSLVVLEDIGAVVAENLIELFKIVLNRGVKLFIDPNEVFLYVPLWHKFNELIFVLGASLLDISDRWADGKGPLALQFTPYELKQLIRALFQNSDRRAAVLSRIRE